MARGLNGQTAFTAEHVHIGYVDGQSYGYRGMCPVTVGVRMERLDGCGTYETTDHRQVRRPLDFAMSAQVWQPDGREMIASSAGGEEILAAIVAAGAYAPGWDADKIATLQGFTGQHLNAMSAGCDHQTIVYETDQYGRERPSLTLTLPCRHPDAMRLHPGEPETDESPARPGGYRYGSAWLLRELPPSMLADVQRLFAGAQELDPGQVVSDDRIHAKAKRRDRRPAWATNDGRDPAGQWWDVTLTNARGASMAVPFWQGSAHTKPPTATDVLNCLISDAAGYENARDLYDWASEYGYETDSDQARRDYQLIGGQVAELRAFLGDRYDAYIRGEA